MKSPRPTIIMPQYGKKPIRFPIRVRLILTFVFVTLLSVSLVGGIGMFISRQSLNDVVGTHLSTLAEGEAATLDRFINQQVIALQVLALNQIMISGAEIANLQYSTSESSIRSAIDRLDTEWAQATTESNLVQSRIGNNSMSNNMRQFRQLSPDHVELILTDRNGGLVAASTRTSNYDQSGEEWWQRARQGEIYIGQPLLDESTNTNSIIIAVPVIHGANNNVIGVMRSTYSVNGIINQIERVHIGESGRIAVLLPNGRLLGMNTTLPPADLRSIDNLRESGNLFANLRFNGNQRLFSITSVGVEPAIKALGWEVLLYQEEGEALEPVKLFINFALIATLVAAIIAAIIAFGFSEMIARPLSKVAEAAKAISEGKLNQRVGFQSQDEIGQLAQSFDAMAATLEERIESEQAAQAERIKLQEDIIQVQQATLKELATPLIPLTNGILLLPLIGSINAERAEQIFQVLLHQVSERHARQVIIDITGIPTIDGQVARTLIQAAQGARMLGAEVVLTGIRSEVAQTLVNLDISLDQLVIAADLESILSAPNGNGGKEKALRRF